MSDLLTDETGAQRLIGFVVDLSGETARCWLDVDERHLNRHGVLHGGISATLLDVASGFTVSLAHDPTGRAPSQTVTLDAQFVAPARRGRVTATARITGAGRSLAFVAAELTDEAGRLVATSAGVFKRAAA